VFNRLFVNMVKAGELGGVLEVVLNRLSEFMEKAQKIKGKVKAAMFYPVAVLIVAVCIILINMQEHDSKNESDPDKLHFWLVNALQWFFGGLLSTYLVFYFRSGTLAVSWPFFVILAAAFIANERLKKHYARLTFQISILFLSIMLFSAYIVPVIMHQIGQSIFIISSIVSVVVLALFLWILRLSASEKFAKSRRPLFFSLTGIFVIINALYFYNIIPPLPLSLKDAGIYQAFTVNGPGNYTAQSEDQGIWGFLRSGETIHAIPGTTLYAYSAIFSPTSFKTSVIHEWQQYDDVAKAWATRGRVTLATAGGRDGGYRTFSSEENLAPGKWRVNVKTPEGQIIGRLSFDLIAASSTPALRTVNIN